jgi:hypothetical protein
MFDGLGESFTLPDGYVDGAGSRHRDGFMRPATLLDETRALRDFRVYLNPELFLSVVLSRVVGRLGGVDSVDPGRIDGLSEEDRRFLEGIYRRLNGYPPSREESARPSDESVADCTASKP